jgi:hypothetical protein
MDNYKTFITDSLVNYDKNMKEQNKLLKNATSYEYINSDDNTENDKIIFFDENNNKILTADYEAVSTYYSEFGTWLWAWANPSFSKKWTRIITKILTYGFSLDPLKNYHLKSELINSRFIITDPIQIDIYLAVSSALSKINNIYNIVIPLEKKKETLSSYKHDLEENNKDFEKKFQIVKNYDNLSVKIQYIFLFNIITS